MEQALSTLPLFLNADAPELRLITSAFANPEGRFVDGTGSPSDIGSVIHDSLYYQNFSYVISSSKQREEYSNIVEATVHPAGFVMFGELRIDTRVEVSRLLRSKRSSAEVLNN